MTWAIFVQYNRLFTSLFLLRNFDLTVGEREKAKIWNLPPAKKIQLQTFLNPANNKKIYISKRLSDET